MRAKGVAATDTYKVSIAYRDGWALHHWHGVLVPDYVLPNAGELKVTVRDLPLREQIDIPALERLSTSRRMTREFAEEFRTADGRRIFLLADGRLINLAAAEGHPASVMDMSFANQALSAEFVVGNATSLERKVYPVPEEIDTEIARLKLETMDVAIDELTEEQAKYLASWDEGT